MTTAPSSSASPSTSTPLDAHVIADSETVPEIIGGIPLRMREIQVNINQPNFMINPTNCSPFSVGSEGVGDQGTAVSLLLLLPRGQLRRPSAFAPKMSITQLGGHKATARGKDPSLAVRPQHHAPATPTSNRSRSPCPRPSRSTSATSATSATKAELASDQCAGRQPIGTVNDETPLLEKPLEGPAYAVSGFGGGVLPHIVFILGGQVTVMPEAESTTVSRRAPEDRRSR